MLAIEVGWYADIKKDSRKLLELGITQKEDGCHKNRKMIFFVTVEYYMGLTI